MSYSDKYGEFFGRLNEDGDVIVLYESGERATRLDCSLYVVGSDGSKSIRHEHPEGIVISRADARKIGLEIEDDTAAEPDARDSQEGVEK